MPKDPNKDNKFSSKNKKYKLIKIKSEIIKNFAPIIMQVEIIIPRNEFLEFVKKMQ